MLGGVFEGDELERRIELVAAEQALVLHERQQRFLEVEAVAGVVHVENRVVTLVGIGGNHCVQLFGSLGRPVLEFSGPAVPGQQQGQAGGEDFRSRRHVHFSRKVARPR
ncbi:hypothetical protein D3C81_1737800 [compost metagenome]